MQKLKADSYGIRLSHVAELADARAGERSDRLAAARRSVRAARVPLVQAGPARRGRHGRRLSGDVSRGRQAYRHVRARVVSGLAADDHAEQDPRSLSPAEGGAESDGGDGREP